MFKTTVVVSSTYMFLRQLILSLVAPSVIREEEAAIHERKATIRKNAAARRMRNRKNAATTKIQSRIRSIKVRRKYRKLRSAIKSLQHLARYKADVRKHLKRRKKIKAALRRVEAAQWHVWAYRTVRRRAIKTKKFGIATFQASKTIFVENVKAGCAAALDFPGKGILQAKKCLQTVKDTASKMATTLLTSVVFYTESLDAKNSGASWMKQMMCWPRPVGGSIRWQTEVKDTQKNFLGDHKVYWISPVVDPKPSVRLEIETKAHKHSKRAFCEGTEAATNHQNKRMKFSESQV